MPKRSAYLLPPLPSDGSVGLTLLTRYAREYDTLSDEPTTALDFVGWLRIEAAAADRRDAIGRRLAPSRPRGRTVREAASPPG